MKRKPKMKIVCAWCKMVISKGEKGGQVSHGICDCCRRDVTKAIEKHHKNN